MFIRVQNALNFTRLTMKFHNGGHTSLYPSHSILTRANPDFYLVQILSIGSAKSEIKLKIYDLLQKKVDAFLYFFMPGDLQFTTHFTCLAW